VGTAAKGGVALAKTGIKVGAKELEKMADMANIAKAEAAAGKPMQWSSLEGAYSKKLEGGYGTVTTTVNGKVVENTVDYSSGVKGTQPTKVIDRLDELKLDGFNPYDNPRYKEMSPDQQKTFLKEYNKQLQAQQDAINSMTADEFKIARDAYIQQGRNPAADSMQRSLGREFEREVSESIRQSLINKGVDRSTATQMAKDRAKEIRSSLAALHEPDMVAGGWTTPAPVRMGDTNVNSSIGASWSSRLSSVDQAVDTAISTGAGSAKLNVRLELLRGAQAR
jgi:filamentous hemagglutinin